MVTVSIIMPTYNRAKYLKETIDSVLSQDFIDFEFIIVDDGSKDNTKEIILSYNDDRIKYFYQDNKGRSCARNNALTKVTGKYIAFIDSDDLFLEGKIRKQVEFLETHNEYDMVYSSSLVIDENGKLFDFVYNAEYSGDIYEKVAFYLPTVIILPTVMIRKEVIDMVGGFDENLHRFEDTDMWRRICKKLNAFAFPEYMCKIRTHSDNRMEQFKKLCNSIDFYVKKVFREDYDKPKSFLRQGASNLYFCYANSIHKNRFLYNNWKRYFAYLCFKGIIYDPNPLKRLFIIFLNLIYPHVSKGFLYKIYVKYFRKLFYKN